MSHEELLRQAMNVNPGQDAQLEVCQQRVAELERWQKVDLENYKRHLAELTEMLTAATDVAVQRGKALDAVHDIVVGKFDYIVPEDIIERLEEIVADADGG